MNRAFVAVAVLGGALALGGCATVLRSPNTAWQVNSSPSGAAVRTSNGYICDATPCSLKMPRRSKFVATVSHSGYEPVTVDVTNHVSLAGGAAFLGNAMIGGLFGATLDVITGATQDLTPNGSLITLRPIPLTPDMAAYWTGDASGVAAVVPPPGDPVTIRRF